MKNIYSALKYLFILVLTFTALNLNAQLQKWILGSSQANASGTFNTLTTNNLKFYEVDFTGTISSTQRVTGSSINNLLSLGTQDVMQTALDATGNVAFYAFGNTTVPFQSSGPINPDTIYFAAHSITTGKDEIFGKVATEGWGSSVIESELVKKPGSTTDYYFIYKTKAGSSTLDNIKYVTINSVTKAVSSPITIIANEKTGEGMAVSQEDCNNNQRWLFTSRPETSGDITIKRCTITNTGISVGTVAYTISIPGNSISIIVGIELSPMNNKFAISNYTSSAVNKDVILLDFNNSTGALTNEVYYTNQSGNPIVTMEFSPDGARIYFLQGGSSAFPNLLYACPVTTTNYIITASQQLSGLTLSNSLTLETGFDGKLYINPSQNANFLYVIANPNSATPVVSTTATNLFGVGQRIGAGFPDQVDGPDSNTSLSVSISSSATSICNGQSVSLTGAGGAAYQWSGGSTDTTAIITVSPASTTNYYLQGSNGTCVDYDTITIIVNSSPVATISPSTNICSGQSVVLTASGAGSYQWSGGSNATTSSITVNPSSTTIYTVTPFNGTCAGPSLSDTVTVTATPISSIAFSDDSICAGTTVTLTASGGSSYQWNGGSVANSPTITVSPTTTTNYYLQVSNGLCVDNDTFVVYASAFPTAAVSGGLNICSGQSTTLTASGGTSYLWSGGVTANTSTITVSPLSTTTYNVTPINDGCSGVQLSVTVNVTPSPIAEITSSDDSICAGTTVTLTASGGTNYQWGGGSTASVPVINVSPLTTTNYYLQVSSGSCIDNDTITIYSYPIPVGLINGITDICSGQSTTLTASGALSYQWTGEISSTNSSLTVNPLTTSSYTVIPINGSCTGVPINVTVNVTASPIAEILFIDDSICSGNTTTLTGSGGTNYQWSGGSVASVPVINVSPINTTNYYLQVSNGSCIDLDTLILYAFNMPVGSVSANDSICYGQYTTLNASGAISYQWSGGSTLTTSSITVSPEETTNYILTPINGNCEGTPINFTVNVFPVPVANFEISSLSEASDYSVQFNNLSQDGISCVTYFGDGDSLVGCNWTSSNHVFPSAGDYLVTQIVTNGQCSDTIYINVQIEEQNSLFIPNSFSPDGNGLNDFFNVYSIGATKFKLMIFDRWGELIFETNDSSKGWDGKYKGKDVEQGVYIWKFDYSNKIMGNQQKIGHITVLR